MKPMEESGLEAVRVVYRRACLGHLPKKPYIHMAWAAFEERHGMVTALIFIIIMIKSVKFILKTENTSYNLCNILSFILLLCNLIQTVNVASF